MEFFRKTTSIDFMNLRYMSACFSIFIFISSLLILFHNGLNLGLDFTGGTQFVLQFDKEVNSPEIREHLNKAGFEKAVVQSYGTSKEILVSIPPIKGLSETEMRNNLLQSLSQAQLERMDFVGPKVGKELATKGTLAVVISLICTMIYIMMRFEYRFAVSSTVALIHDPVLILGVFSLFHLEFDLIALGALLAILGYSLNDTIVVFDRVRENFKKVRKKSPLEIMNLSINQTLSRTIMTSGLTLLVVTALFFYGGETLRGFSVALMVGIVIGTYSSIYVAGALAVAMGLNRNDFLPQARKEIDDRP